MCLLECLRLMNKLEFYITSLRTPFIFLVQNWNNRLFSMDCSLMIVSFIQEPMRVYLTRQVLLIQPLNFHLLIELESHKWAYDNWGQKEIEN